jgi:NTE family protein
MVELGVASKMSGELAFFEHLRAVGRDCASAWLGANFDAIGRRSSVDLGAMLPHTRPRP